MNSKTTSFIVFCLAALLLCVNANRRNVIATGDFHVEKTKIANNMNYISKTKRSEECEENDFPECLDDNFCCTNCDFPVDLENQNKHCDSADSSSFIDMGELVDTESLEDTDALNYTGAPVDVEFLVPDNISMDSDESIYNEVRVPDEPCIDYDVSDDIDYPVNENFSATTDTPNDTEHSNKNHKTFKDFYNPVENESFLNIDYPLDNDVVDDTDSFLVIEFPNDSDMPTNSSVSVSTDVPVITDTPAKSNVSVDTDIDINFPLDDESFNDTDSSLNIEFPFGPEESVKFSTHSIIDFPVDIDSYMNNKAQIGRNVHITNDFHVAINSSQLAESSVNTAVPADENSSMHSDAPISNKCPIKSDASEAAGLESHADRDVSMNKNDHPGRSLLLGGNSIVPSDVSMRSSAAQSSLNQAIFATSSVKLMALTVLQKIALDFF